MLHIASSTSACNTIHTFADLRRLYPEFPGFKAAGTSEEAAQAIAPRVKGLRLRVLNVFKGSHPQGMTPDEAADSLKLSILSVRPRCSELRRLGLLERMLARHPNDSGCQANVLRATQKAMVSE